MPKSKLSHGNLTIFIFPYLFIDKEIEIEGYKLKPSYKEIFDKQSPRVKSHLKKIAQSFRFQNGGNINQYTFGSVYLHNKQEWTKLNIFLDKLSTVYRYQNISENSGATYGNFSYVVFEIVRASISKKFSYYEGFYNGKNSLPVHYPETKIFPSYMIRPFIYNTDQQSQVTNHFLGALVSFHHDDDLNRLLRSIEWFNNSLRQDLEVDDFDRFTSLAIAFETLFNSPPELIRATISSNITSLLGNTPQLTDWVKDFYDQRSSIVHGKEKPSMKYRGIKATEFHISHLVEGRKIFSRCLGAMLNSRETVYVDDIHRELIPNETRIKEINQKLLKTDNEKSMYEKGIFSLVDSLSQSDPTGKLQEIYKITDKFLPSMAKLFKKIKQTSLLDLTNKIIAFDKTKYADLALLYSEVHSQFSPIYLNPSNLVEEIPDLSFKGAIYSLTSFMSWKLFREAFENKGN